MSRTNVDAEDVSTDIIAAHEFTSGVYMVQVETIFDNTTMGQNWFNDDEISVANNKKRVIFNVESVDDLFSCVKCFSPKLLDCWRDSGQFADK